MTRSLVLAGGGMRVAWQAGVMRAIEEEPDLAFDHVDGTSGGILTAGMILSGIGGAEMCRRWRGLGASAFASALPFLDYLKGPWSLPALGDADGIIGTVFPALGIDADLIRSSEDRGLPAGTFNVVEFTSKEALALEAAEVDAELLAAGLSLPGWVTPLRREGKIYTDAVWVRDAGVAEAVRRGADEIWLIWCIGNTPYWGDGPLEQYVHMIEMSAMGALLADFELAKALGREFTLHVIKPTYPLPLDPEFYLGRISSDSLVAMGYADARAYLAARRPAGVAQDATCTRMLVPPVSVRFTDALRGSLDGLPVSLDLTVQVPVDRPVSAGSVVGSIAFEPWGDPVYIADGVIELYDGVLSYSGVVRVDGEDLPVIVRRELVDDPGPDAWSDFTSARVRLGRRSFEATLGAAGSAALAASVEPVGAHGPLERLDAVRRFWALLGAIRVSSPTGPGR